MKQGELIALICLCTEKMRNRKKAKVSEIESTCDGSHQIQGSFFRYHSIFILFQCYYSSNIIPKVTLFQFNEQVKTLQFLYLLYVTLFHFFFTS
jgi:hypothetical protein